MVGQQGNGSCEMGMMKDSAGLSKPLTRLVDVVAAGCGNVAKPILTVANAKADALALGISTKARASSLKELAAAQAEVMGKLSPAMTEASSNGLATRYEDGANLQMDALAVSEQASLAMRAERRIQYQSMKRQMNVENVVGYAIESLRNEENVSDKMPDDDWISRFFRETEDINAEHMQELWGKILAGEVKLPGSYSLRTLDALRNITTAEAEVFTRVARYAIGGVKSCAFIPNIVGRKEFADKYANIPIDCLRLAEVGLVVMFPGLQVTFKQRDKRQFCLSIGNTMLLIDGEIVPFEQIQFSSVGTQLLKLTEKKSADLLYVSNLAKFLHGHGATRVQRSEVADWRADGAMKPGQFHDIPLE